jgi:hypothetical protein
MRSRDWPICWSSAPPAAGARPDPRRGGPAGVPIPAIPLGLRDALLDGAALLHLRFQPAAGAFGFHFALGQLAPLFGEMLLVL